MPVTLVVVTAMYSVDREPAPADRHPLAPGASPAVIRAHLLPDDRPVFDRSLAEATEELRRTLDLTGLFQTLEHWRLIAVVQGDRAGFTRLARRLAEQNTGQPSPDDEPLAVTREKAGM